MNWITILRHRIVYNFLSPSLDNLTNPLWILRVAYLIAYGDCDYSSFTLINMK